MKLIINAEDFGFSKSINQGIVFCLENKLVTSASIMVTAPYAEEAFSICKEKGFNNIGIHLNLTWGFPLLPAKQIKSLVEPNGKFHYMCSMPFYGKYADAKKELEAQIKKFLNSGLKPTHLDFHHYFCEMPEIFKAYIELAKKYNLPCRVTNTRCKEIANQYNVKTADAFCNSFHDYYATTQTLKALVDNFKTKDITVELMTTPGFIDEYTVRNTSYLNRENEIEQLKKAKNENIFDGIELINFSQI